MLELSLPRLPHPILYISKSDLPICVMATCGRRLHLVRSLPTSTKMHWYVTTKHIHKCDLHVIAGRSLQLLVQWHQCLPTSTTMQQYLQFNTYTSVTRVPTLHQLFLVRFLPTSTTMQRYVTTKYIHELIAGHINFSW